MLFVLTPLTFDGLHVDMQFVGDDYSPTLMCQYIYVICLILSVREITREERVSREPFRVEHVQKDCHNCRNCSRLLAVYLFDCYC